MNNIKLLLAKWLKAKGIESYYSMNEIEKEAYRNIEIALEGKELTAVDVKKFWDDLIGEITDKLVSENLTDKERDFLIVELRLTKKIISFLYSSETQSANARMIIEQQLSN